MCRGLVNEQVQCCNAALDRFCEARPLTVSCISQRYGLPDVYVKREGYMLQAFAWMEASGVVVRKEDAEKIVHL